MGWIGDSTCWSVGNNGIRCISTPHKADRESERIRIENDGGVITGENDAARVNGELAVTRALGNSGPRPLISTEAEFVFIDSEKETPISKLILISDGITGVYYQARIN